MLPYNTGVTPPKSPDDFEEFCLVVYRIVFQDPFATRNGRTGQKQDGVDIFVRKDQHRVGVQCKRVTFGKMTRAIIEDEVAKADAGDVPLTELVVATTAPSDAKLVGYTQQLSDERRAAGKFSVNVAFWDTFESYINQHAELQRHFAPEKPGGALYEQGKKLDVQQQILETLQQQMLVLSASPGLRSPAMPDARSDSVDKLVDGQLDSVKQQLRSGQYREALTRLSELGDGLGAFDDHQKARWYTQRALCYWHTANLTFAARDFATAFEFAPDDEKIAGNAVRGLMLAENFQMALQLADTLRERFPTSGNVYSAWANVRQRCELAVAWESDTPPELRNETDVRYTFGWLELLKGNYEKAVEHADFICDQPDPTFEYKALFALSAINLAMRDGVLASAGVVSSEARAILPKVLANFEPFDEMLWTNQDDSSVAQTVACIGYALLLTQEVKRARDVLLRAVQRFPSDPQLHRIALEAISRADGEDAAFIFGKSHLAQLDDRGQMIVAEMAGQRGDVDTVHAVGALEPKDVEYGMSVSDLQAFEWLALANSGRAAEVLPQFTDARLQEASVPLRTIAAILLSRTDNARAQTIAENLLAGLREDSTTRDVVLIAQLCRALERYDDVIRLLQARLPRGSYSQLHKRLFEALIRGGRRKTANEMLRHFPLHAMEDEDVRRWAIELAQAANDWSELSKLSEMQLGAHPDRAYAWVFRAVVLLRQSRLSDVRELFDNDISFDLKGSVRVRAQLGRLDMEYGSKSRGLKRIYRVFRDEPHDQEAASAYLANLLLMPSELLPDEPQYAEPGSAVGLANENGETRHITVDPSDIGNPPHSPSFFPSTHPLSQQLLGKQVGDMVEVEDALQATHSYRIGSIASAYKRLAAIAQELIHASGEAGGPIMSVSIPTQEDGTPDVSNIISLLAARSERIKEAFSAYGRGPVTIGLVGQFIGVSAAEIAGDWPGDDSPKLYVCSGDASEVETAHALLNGATPSFVTDLATINELVASDLEDCLRLCQPLYIAASALETLGKLKAASDDDRSSGRMKESDGKLVIVETNDDYKAQQRAHLTRLQEVIDRYCEVAPAYGSDELPEEFEKLADVLDEESHDLLLLALEKEAAVLTLDGRLREIGRLTAGLRGVWPQVLAAHGLARGAITQATYSKFVVASLLKRRSHVRVSAEDLFWLSLQGKELQRLATPVVLAHLADNSVGVAGAADVATTFVKTSIVRGATYAATRNIIRTVFAALFTRTDISPSSLHVGFCLDMRDFLNAFSRMQRGHPLMRTASKRARELWYATVDAAIADARAAGTEESREAVLSRTFDVKPVYPFHAPLIIAESLPTNIE
ncbi:hypothetical protein V4C53_10430 [Paraburkholderia azotifigens]|uniref:PIN domain-containing protein n=1 Tax=Paraburkholderia azotifigens TaxID=2057004 RepID=UPI00316B8649